jgi:hypothetical protein
VLPGRRIEHHAVELDVVRILLRGLSLDRRGEQARDKNNTEDCKTLHGKSPFEQRPNFRSIRIFGRTAGKASVEFAKSRIVPDRVETLAAFTRIFHISDCLFRIFYSRIDDAGTIKYIDWNN